MAEQSYRVFLLRLWRVEGEGRGAWRASLEDAHSGERRGFGDLPALHGFLAALLDPRPPEPAWRPQTAEGEAPPG